MDELLIKYLLEEASPEEAARVERWLAADAVNRARYEQFKAVWGLGRRMAESGSASSSSGQREAWRGFKQKLEQGVAPVAPVRRIIRGRAAAVFIGLLVLGAASYALFWRSAQPSGKSLARVKAPQGSAEAPGVIRSLAMPEEKGLHWAAGAKPRRDTLPDGTVVTLNRGASLAVVEKGSGELTVRLQGEAFFSVRHDPSRVFIVQSGRVSVRVLGTSFELKGGDTVELVVETGAVAVSRAGGSVVVRAGEQLSVTGSAGWNKTATRDKLYGYYLGRPLVCDSTPLRRVVSVVNAAYDAHLVLGRAELGDLPLTTEFLGMSPEKIAEIIAATFNLSIVRQGAAIILQ
jgi:ferric-dicitrate binding protein FerR (iron transport regulator)